MTVNGNLEGLGGTLVIFDSFNASSGNIVDLHVILTVNCTGTLTSTRFDLYRSQFEVQGFMEMMTNNIYFWQDSQFLISASGTFKAGQSSGRTDYHPHSTHHLYPGFVVYGTYVHERTQDVARSVVMVLHPGAFYHVAANTSTDIWYHRTFDYGADILVESLLWNRCGQNTVADEFHKNGGNLNISSTGELVCRITVSHIYANVYVEEGGQINTFDSPSRTYIHQLDPINGILGLVRYCNQLYLYGGGYVHALISAGRPGTNCNSAAYHLGGDPRGLVVLGGMTWHRRSITFDSVDSSIIVNGHLEIRGTETNQDLTLNRGKLVVNGTGQYLRSEALRINHEGSLEISPVAEFVSTGTDWNNFIYSSSTVVGTIVNFGTYFDSFSSNIHTYSVDIHNYGTFVRDGVSSYSRIMPGNFTNYPAGTLVVRGLLYFYTATSFHGKLLLENGQLRLYGSPHIFHWDSQISATDGQLACYNSDSWFYGVLNQTFGGAGIRLVQSYAVVFWRAHESILGTGTVLVSTGTVYVNTIMAGVPHFDVSGGTVEYLISEPIIRLATLSSGLITAGSSVFISGYFRINQGTFFSFGNIYVMDGATLDVDSVNSCTLSEVTVVNDGRVLYSSGSFLPSHSLVVNHNLLETVASLRTFSVPINNFGVINQSDPMSVTDLSGRVTNYNLLNSAFGTLKLTGGLTNFGTINVAETGTLDFADGMSSFFDGTLLSGNGDVVFTGGYIDVLSPPSDMDLDTLSVAGATIDFHCSHFTFLDILITDGVIRVSNKMSVSNDLILSGGLLSDVGVIDTRLLSVIDPADKAMSLTTVKVLERASFKEGTLLSRDGASFVVTENATYVFDNPNDVAILDDGGVRSEFINYGVVTKTSYGYIVNIGTFLENYGLVSSAAGDLQLTGGSDHYGVFSIEVGGKISLRDGIHNLFLESYIIGSGILEISGSAESLSRSYVFLNDNAKVLQTGGDSVWDNGLNVTNDYSIFQLDDGIMTFFGSTGEMFVSQFIINGGKLFVPAELTIRRGIHQTDGLFSTSGVSTIYSTYVMDGGEQSGSGRTYVEESFLWNEGLLSGLGSTIFNNYAEWATAGRKHIDERYVENFGTIDWFDGHLYGSRGTMFLNMENTTINTGNVDWLRTEGSALLRNFGNITKLDVVFVNDDGYCSSPRLHGIPNDWSDSTNFISTTNSTLVINDGIFTVMGIRDTLFDNGLSFAAFVRLHTPFPGWGTSTGYLYQGKISYSENVELEFRQRYVWLSGSSTHRYDERVTLRVSTTEGNTVRTYTFSGVAANSWRHYTVVRQESDFHLYRDGAQQTSISLGGTFPRTENNTFLFGDYSADFEIDNIRVYERPLTTEEALYLTSFECPGADLMSSSLVSHGLVGLYTFNDPQDLFFALADCETISPEGNVNWRYARHRIEWIVENRATIRAENGSVEFLGGGFSDGRLSALETGTFIFGRERVTLAGVIDTAQAIVIDSGDHEIRTDMNVLILQTGGTLSLTPPAECPPKGEYDLTAPRIILDGGELRVPRALDLSKNCYFLNELIFKSGLLTVQGDLTILEKFHQDAGLAVVDGALTARTEYVKNGGILEGVGVLTSTHNFDWNGGILRGSGGSIVFLQ
ncbi:hypothetical protein GEMRC1_005764 [Eukaryota sp. GEM-RC1]